MLPVWKILIVLNKSFHPSFSIHLKASSFFWIAILYKESSADQTFLQKQMNWRKQIQSQVTSKIVA